MSKDMNILGVIPARGGSKSIPRKNIVPLLDKPLVAYTIEAALQSRLLSRTIVSTEDEEIAAICREWGVEVPFKRPLELATDDALSLPVMQHAIGEMERMDRIKYDAAVMLQPTTPLRLASDIDIGIDLLQKSGADSVVSVVDVGAYHPLRMKRIVGDSLLINYIDQGFENMRPRQELPAVYIRSGDLYISRREVIMETGTLVGKTCRAIVIPSERAVNIDTMFDLLLVEYRLKKQAEEQNR